MYRKTRAVVNRDASGFSSRCSSGSRLWLVLEVSGHGEGPFRGERCEVWVGSECIDEDIAVADPQLGLKVGMTV